MPSSDPETIPTVIAIVKELDPYSILDIGVGNGRYGLLFREFLDLNKGFFYKEEWGVVIDGYEIEKAYITPVHTFAYTSITIGDWITEKPLRKQYDLAFMGDVLEHWEEGVWQKALEKAKNHAKSVIVVSPNWDGSIKQGAWCGFEHEKHKSVLSPQKVGGRCLFASNKHLYV